MRIVQSRERPELHDEPAEHDLRSVGNVSRLSPTPSQTVRAAWKRKLRAATSDPPAEILLEHIVELEEHSFKVIQAEMNELPPDHSTYLITGPALSVDALHAVDCRCSGEPSLDDSIECALTSDQRLDEFFARIENSSAAPSITGLVKRLRDVEQTKSQQIAKFTRED